MGSKIVTTSSASIRSQWTDVPAWAAVNDGTYTTVISGTAIVIEQNEVGATFHVYVVANGGNASTINYVRVIRASDGKVVLNSPGRSGNSYIEASATADVVAGEEYKVQAYKSGPANPTLNPNGYLTII